MSLPADRLRPKKAQTSLSAGDACPPATKVLLQGILPVAAAAFGIPVEDIVGQRRRPRYVEARAFVTWALRSLGQPLSYPAIGELLGDRDHTSVIYLHEKAETLRLRSAEFRTACRQLEASFRSIEEKLYGHSSH